MTYIIPKITNLVGAAWRTFFTDAGGHVRSIPLGPAGTYLKSTGTAAVPEFGAASNLDATSGSVGGWNITTTAITKNNATLDSAGVFTLGTGNDIIKLSSVDALYREWAGNAVASSAPFKVSKTGVLYATGADINGNIEADTGYVGGWDISAGSLAKNNVTLSSAGELTLGTGNDIAKLSSVDGTYREWIGHATAGSAPFRVTKAGALTASNATITGSVTATSGNIAGWDLSANSLSKNNTEINSAGDITLGTGDDVARLSSSDSTYRIWVGDATAADAPFSVDKDGNLVASSAEVEGTITATSGSIGGWTVNASTLQKLAAGVGVILDSAIPAIKVGDTGNTYIIIDGANKVIKSSNYSSGASGFNIAADTGNAEFNNITARGLIKSAVFEKDTVSTVGGNILVLPGDTLAIDMTAADNSTVTITGTDTFAVGDILRMKDVTNDEWLEVTNIASAPTYTVTRDKAGVYVAGAKPAWKKGQAVVNYGGSGNGGILLTGGDNPELSVFTHAGSPWTTITNGVTLNAGMLTAGSGDVILDGSGITIQASESYKDEQAIKWCRSSGANDIVGGIYTSGADGSGTDGFSINLNSDPGNDTYLEISAWTSGDNAVAEILIENIGGGGNSSIYLYSIDDGAGWIQDFIQFHAHSGYVFDEIERTDLYIYHGSYGFYPKSDGFYQKSPDDIESKLLDSTTKLDDLAAPDNNTDLNASATAHGLLPILSNVATQYLNGTGAWTTPGDKYPLEARLTLETGIAISTTDQTAKTAIYLTPYKGDQVAIYSTSGSTWSNIALSSDIHIDITEAQTGTTHNGTKVIDGLTNTSQLIVGMEVTGTNVGGSAKIASIDSATQITTDVNSTGTAANTITFKVPASTVLDIFVINNSGTLALRMVKWTNTTTRATALALQNGVYRKNGDASWGYVGTVMTTTTTGQIEDSLANRLVWNYNNRVLRMNYCAESTAHAYNGALRKWNNSDTNNLLKSVIGVAEDITSLSMHSYLKGYTTTWAQAVMYVDGAAAYTNLGVGVYSNIYGIAGSACAKLLAIGAHTFQVYEYGNSASNNFVEMKYFVTQPM